MNAREVLITFHNKYKGDWDKIYASIVAKEAIEEPDLTGADDLITILDSNYPEDLKTTYRPPFVITKEQAQKKTFKVVIELNVQAYNEMQAHETCFDALCEGDFKIKSIKEAK